MRIYLDNCCLSRIFDDQDQSKVRQETEAILLILSHLQDGTWTWISSDILGWEVEKDPNEMHRTHIENLLTDAHQYVAIETGKTSRGIYLESISFDKKDALHLACAESGSADVLLTTDNKLFKKAKSVQTELNIQVDNPLAWLQKVTKNENT